MPLTFSNVPIKFRGKNQNRFGEKSKNVITDPKNCHHFLRSRSFEVKFADKMPLTPSNIPTTFRWNNQNSLEKSAKNVISDSQMAAISKSQGCLRSNWQTGRPLSLATSLPNFVGIKKIRFREK